MSFDHQTAADLACGRPVSGEKARSFAQSARRTYDDRESLTRVIADLRRELALRDGEIVMLKGLLLEREESTPNTTLSRPGTPTAGSDETPEPGSA